MHSFSLGYDQAETLYIPCVVLVCKVFLLFMGVFLPYWLFSLEFDICIFDQFPKESNKKHDVIINIVFSLCIYFFYFLFQILHRWQHLVCSSQYHQMSNKKCNRWRCSWRNLRRRRPRTISKWRTWRFVGSHWLWFLPTSNKCLAKEASRCFGSQN